MKSNVTKALEKCTSFRKNAPTEPRIVVQLLATTLCLMLSELAGMAKDLFKIVPPGIPQQGVKKISCDRLKNVEKKAKKQFKNYVSIFITDFGECKSVIKAFEADIDGLKI